MKSSRWTMVMVGVLAFFMLATMVSASPLPSAPSAPLQAHDAKNADKVDGLHASKRPKANTLLALSKKKKFPASVIPGTFTRDGEVMTIVKRNDGPGSGLNADRLDGKHASAFWSVTGNAGTTPGTNFLGTTDWMAMEFWVHNIRALRLEPSPDVNQGPNLIGGNSGNTVTDAVKGATIGGGGSSTYPNAVTGDYGTVGGGESNTAGRYATVAGGEGITASAPHATVGGGMENTASGAGATVPGGYFGEASLRGQMAYASGRFANRGDAQASLYVLRNTTTDATATELFLDGSAEPLTIADGRTLTFDILVVARSSTGQSAGYHIQGVIENVGGATSFIGAPTVTTLGEDDATWNVAAQADDTNDALVIKVTGKAGTNIRWVATVRTAEVAY